MAESANKVKEIRYGRQTPHTLYLTLLTEDGESHSYLVKAIGQNLVDLQGVTLLCKNMIERRVR
jgi:hypothetical protein